MDPLASMTAREVRFCAQEDAISIQSIEYEARRAYLGSNELESGELTPCLLLDELVNLGVGLLERGVEAGVLADRPRHQQTCLRTWERWIVNVTLTKSLGTGTEEDILIAARAWTGLAAVLRVVRIDRALDNDGIGGMNEGEVD